MAGSVGNGSGHDVDYEVEPSDPGGIIKGDTQMAMYSLIAGTVAVGVGCLTHIGGRGLVYLGVGLLVLALVFQVRALRRLRTLARRTTPVPAAIQSAGGGKTPLPDGQEHAKTFVAGTSRVVFYSDQEPFEPLAASPPLPDANARVVLRKCGTPSTLAQQTQQQAASTSGEYYVEF